MFLVCSKKNYICFSKIRLQDNLSNAFDEKINLMILENKNKLSINNNNNLEIWLYYFFLHSRK